MSILKKSQKHVLFLLCFIVYALLLFCPLSYSYPSYLMGVREDILVLATTTSVENSGLLAVIVPYFEQTTGIKVKVVAVGTGQAIKLAKEGNADVVIVHNKKQEEDFVKEGHGIKRIPFMRNRFTLAGPKSDPANVKYAKNAVNAFYLIHKEKVTFISRGDKSGTHERELELWRLANIEPYQEGYLEVGAGMEAALRIASEKEAYILTDEATFESIRDKISLEVLFSGDNLLENIYSIIAVNPALHAEVNEIGANYFIEFIIENPIAQNLIETYKKTRDGRPLFYVIPAHKREQF